MDALKNLITNVPDWLKKLDELNGQIEQRQIELAKLTGENKARSPGTASCRTKSVRNKGSTESLRPRDEPEAHPRDPVAPSDANNATEAAAAAAAGAAAAKASTEQPSPPSPSESQSPSALQRQASQMRAAGQARARATLRKRQRTDSVISAEGAAPKYRTRSMIIVYYDSYVQMFFEELVKFVSAGRNMMRKAKMAAKVAQIKRLAELESPDDDDAPIEVGTSLENTPIAVAPSAAAKPGQTTTEDEEPPLLYVSTRRMGAGPGATRNMYSRAGGRMMSRGGGPGNILGADGKPAPPDVYDELDKGLEYVQSMCEHGAHQFLRDGDCGEEVANIKRRLAETKDLADKEMARVEREDPGALLKLAEDDGMKGRSYRPQSMRRDVNKPGSAGGPPPAVSALAAASGPLEVDEGVPRYWMWKTFPKLVWKSYEEHAVRVGKKSGSGEFFRGHQMVELTIADSHDEHTMPCPLSQTPSQDRE
ncbi:hypothetical protein CHGG_03843 [Chaetomium globosum CBS 148.51]|uniref:Uncharacterized protein n=1 Tax=Chaetomium globosum (strain ATCC 6205 / CBS 148.51 / DSM 1962 / NBRC 6347 / NRRL 1970) TaxID=306901 RepID=Q2H303_CHAGB|nr:uncharacterized protein CHGG_03843 [Chaetomium globosum CBS 148.51]EAQ87224.1 hypothetical protein CHGG_03843 [Chaetomium globosum CBS 148.51]